MRKDEINAIKASRGITPGEDFTTIYNITLEPFYTILLVNKAFQVEWNDDEELIKIRPILYTNNQYGKFLSTQERPIEVFTYECIKGFRFLQDVGAEVDDLIVFINDDLSEFIITNEDGDDITFD